MTFFQKILFINLLFIPLVLAEPTADTEQKTNDNITTLQTQDTIGSLQDIWTSFSEKQTELSTLQKKLHLMKEDDAEKKELRLKLEELLLSINEQKQAFEQIAIGGLNVELVEQKVASEEFNWEKELILISRPLIDSLKELTEKPRKMEQLRVKILQLENLLVLIQKARQNISQLLEYDDLPKHIKKQLSEVEETWRKRNDDTQNALELTRYQLNSLQETQTSPQAAIINTLHNFIHGRGLTLVIAIAAIAGILIIMRIISWLLLKIYMFHSQKYQRKIRLRWARLLNYIFWILTTILSVFAVITVFYARNDILLLMITVLGIFMTLISLRNILPRYMTEIRLLLDMGQVRQDERVVYEGVPYQLLTINLFSTLNNPELEGILRLPINTVNTLISRPFVSDEAWFPCSVGDYLLLEDNRLAKVTKQSVEIVELHIMGSVASFPTSQFLQMPIRNLSREGFKLSTTFGVDYQHQAICLTEIPKRLYQGIEQTIKASEWGEHIEFVKVEFKLAGASSLDYFILVRGKGTIANDYYALERFIQAACVEVCNQENWVIPFAQLVIHAGEGLSNNEKDNC